jgi:hypothetical protein
MMRDEQTQEKGARGPSLAVRAVGWASTPLWYLLMVSVVIVAARRHPLAR